MWLDNLAFFTPRGRLSGSRHKPSTMWPSYGSIAAPVLVALASVVVSAMLVYSPKALVLPAVVVCVVLAGWHTRGTLIVVIVGCAVYLGLYLRYRVELGTFPISALDLFPILAFVAAYNICGQHRPLSFSPPGVIAFGLLAGGFIVGCLLGLANNAPLVELAKVGRVEMWLLLTLAAALRAGHARTWQRGVVTGLYVAAAVAAGLQIASFAYATSFHHPFWSSLPFGSTNVADFTESLTPKLVASTRDNYLPTFIMLPGLALTVYRRRRIDFVLMVAILMATAMCLSRAMWLAALITVVIALAARFASRRALSTRATLGILVGTVTTVLVVGNIGDGILSARLASSFGRTDISLSRRQSETDEGIQRLTATPFTVVAGLGAGAFVPMINERAPTPILENQLLAKWTNFGLLSVLGTIWLLAFGGITAFRSLRRGWGADPDLMALGLSLPAILLVSMFSGTLLELNVSFAVWLLAGSVFAAAHERSPAP